MQLEELEPSQPHQTHARLLHMLALPTGVTFNGQFDQRAFTQGTSAVADPRYYESQASGQGGYREISCNGQYVQHGPVISSGYC